MFPYRANNLRFEDVFTGFIFHEPLEKHKLSLGIPDVFDNNFIQEYIRRSKIISPNKSINKNNFKLLNQINTLNYNNIGDFLNEKK